MNQFVIDSENRKARERMIQEVINDYGTKVAKQTITIWFRKSIIGDAELTSLLEIVNNQ